MRRDVWYLADALALADDEEPEILIDMATLTGAARVALGPDLPPFYINDDVFAGDVAEAREAVDDPLWRMPLWQPYDSKLSSRVADTNNVTSDGFAGSITAALFLQRFVSKANDLGAFRYYRLESCRKAACANWRRSAGDTRSLPSFEATLSRVK